MEIKYYGANCIKLITKQRTIVVDDNLTDVGLKSATKETDSLFYTNRSFEPATVPVANFFSDSPGEFELGSLMVQGYSVRAFKDDDTQKTGILYTFSFERMTVVVTGHVNPTLDSDFLESLGPVDLLVIPIGDHEFTLDANHALKISNKLNPRYLLPTHYADSAVNYPIAQATMAKLVEELGQEAQSMDSLKIKPSGGLEAAATQLIELNRQNV